MHQLIEDLCPYLLALYVLDSLVLGRAHEILLVRPWGAWRVAKAGLQPTGLWPRGEAVVAFDPPLQPAAEGVRDRTEQPETVVPWTDLGPVEVEQRTLRWGKGRRLPCPSPEAARHLARWLVILRDTPPDGRRHQAEALVDAASDVEAVRRLRKSQQKHARVLEGLGWIFWVALFVLLPARVFGGWAPDMDLLYVVLGLSPLHATAVVLAWRTLRACGVPTGPALSTLSTFVFFPPAAAHMRHALGRHLYVRFHPLAVAAVLLPRDRFAELARRQRHRLQLEQRIPPAGDVWSLAERSWLRVVSSAGWSTSEVLRPPPGRDPTAASCCPLCSADYRAGFSVCSDCGVQLEPRAA